MNLLKKSKVEDTMKKILIGCAVAAAVMMFTPTASKADSDWVGPLVVGTIFGVIIGNSSHGHHDHGHSEVIINNHRPYYGHQRRHHRHHRRHQMHEWVEVCKAWPYLRQDHHGDYYTVMRNECRIVKRAIW